MTADYLLVFQILYFVYVARDHINRESMLRRECCDWRPAGLFWMITDYQRALLASSKTFTKQAFLLLKSKLNWLKRTRPDQWRPDWSAWYTVLVTGSQRGWGATKGQQLFAWKGQKTVLSFPVRQGNKGNIQKCFQMLKTNKKWCLICWKTSTTQDCWGR